MTSPPLSLFSPIDALGLLMMALVVFIGLCVGSFAYRYMKGDTQYPIFFIQLTLLIGAVAIMVSTNHLFTLLIAWCVSNILLVQLMQHKSSWKAAKVAALLTAKNYCLGLICIAGAFTLFYWISGETSIKALTQQDTQSNLMLVALVLLLIGAMTQSAIWPFHRWLTSSLNSPTPVSAIMHAGLVNGGGFLLVRFAPLYLKHAYLLTLIFVIGMVTALVGTGWKLMQSDVKRMLACSTMGQMGFMFAQCGLGLFPAAVAHLVCHGMFKAYLFLVSGSAAQEKRLDIGYPPKVLTFICGLPCGIMGSLGFGLASGNSWFAGDSTLLLMVVAFLSATQFSLPLLRQKTLQNFLLSLIAAGLVGLAYGSSVYLIARAMQPMQLMQPQPLNSVYIIGIMALILAWLSILFIRQASLPAWMLQGYVTAINASQPHPATITTHRNDYHYL